MFVFAFFSAHVRFGPCCWLRILEVAGVVLVVLLSYSYQNIASFSGTELVCCWLSILDWCDTSGHWKDGTHSTVCPSLSVCLSVCLFLSLSLAICLSVLFLSLSLWNMFELGTCFKVYGGFNAFHHLWNVSRLGTYCRDLLSCSSLWNNYIFWELYWMLDCFVSRGTYC